MRDGGRRGRCERLEHPFVAGGELLGVALVRQVDVAVDLPADDDGAAEERRHRRVVLGKADARLVRGDVGHAQRVRVGDDRAEDALAVGAVADECGRLGVDAVDDDVVEAPLGVEHAERPVLGAGEFRCGLDESAQQWFELEILAQFDDGGQQSLVRLVRQDRIEGADRRGDHAPMIGTRR